MAENRQPLVWIILVNWNGRNDTLACLDSLKQIDYAPVHILLVDNASSDGTVAAVQKQFPNVEIIENAENLRFARANNQGIRRAMTQGAEFVLLLNNDTLVEPRFLRMLVERAQSDPQIGVVGPKIYYAAEPERLWFAGGTIHLPTGRIAHIGIREIDRGQYDVPRDVDYVTGCCMLMRRACLQAVGLLDESYFMYTEDADWCWRARQHGFRIVFEPRARVWHKISSSSGGTQVAGGLTPFKIYHKIRGMQRFFRRYAAWHHWLTIPIFWAGAFFKAAVLLFATKNRAGLRALFGACATKANAHPKKQKESPGSEQG